MSEFVMVFLPWLIKWLIEWIEEDGFVNDIEQGIKISALLSAVLILSKVCLFSGKFYNLQMRAYAQAFAYVRFLNLFLDFSTFYLNFSDFLKDF